MKSSGTAMLALGIALISCGLPRPQRTSTPPPIEPSPIPTILPTQIPTDPAEAIMILAPGPASQLVSPAHVSGMADSVFEQRLLTRLVLDDGTQLSESFVTIQGPLGGRGSFEGSIEFSVSEPRQALLQVYSLSARDGGITHLSSVGVSLLPEGESVISPRDPVTEAIQILEPDHGSTLTGGSLEVRGTGVASFEGTLVVELYDEQGGLLAQQPLIVEAPEMGMPGEFRIELAYSVDREMPARIVVRDPLPVFDGLGHLASREVRLAP